MSYLVFMSTLLIMLIPLTILRIVSVFSKVYCYMQDRDSKYVITRNA